MPTIKVPYEYEDEDESLTEVTMEVDYIVDRNCDYGVSGPFSWNEFIITGFHCPEYPEAAEQAMEDYRDGKLKYIDERIVNA